MSILTLRRKKTDASFAAAYSADEAHLTDLSPSPCEMMFLNFTNSGTLKKGAAWFPVSYAEWDELPPVAADTTPSDTNSLTLDAGPAGTLRIMKGPNQTLAIASDTIAVRVTGVSIRTMN